MMTMTNNNSNKTTSPTLSSILNKKSISQVDTPMKEYLPTPVTPASDFSSHQFHNHHQIKKDTTSAASSYSTFSVIKPPAQQSASSSISPTTPSSTTTATAATRNNSIDDTTSSAQKPYPCPECHQTFSRPHNLKSHLTTHSSERPFQVKTIIRKN
jgi:hypothetical protein